MAPNPESLSDPVVITRPCQKPIPIQINNDPNLSNTEIPTIKTNQKALSPIGNLANLVIFAIAELLGGFTFSLLSPFYTQEATNKGLTVTQTGVVYGSVFITTIVFSPFFGKYIGRIGSRRMFLYGTFIAGATNVLFGFLEWVEDYFLALSLSIRIVSAIGESAFFCSIYPLATKNAAEENRSTILSIMETMFGIGMMIGPFLGGLLYEVDGFYFPFVICGGSLVAVTLFASCLLNSDEENNNNAINEATSEPTTSTKYINLLKMPSISISCFLLIISEMSVTWYLPTLEPFLKENFNNISTITTGAMFMVEGATYAVFSPIWGLLLTRGLSPQVALLIGCLGVVFGFGLLGPAPFLYFLPKNIYVVATGLVIQGSCVAATFITTLVFMMSESVANGASDTEQTRGMITSLWFLSENVAGYLGSSLGGYTFDQMGFESSTLIVIGLQLIALIPLAILCKCRNSKKKILIQNINKRLESEKKIITTDRNRNYQSIIV